MRGTRPLPSRAVVRCAARSVASRPPAFGPAAFALAAFALAVAAATSFAQEPGGGLPERSAEAPPETRPGHGPQQAPGQPFPLLDVPFVPQTPDLCGGAAVAMVARYWGAGGGVSPDDFGHLVSDAARGIPTGDLRRAAEDMGWKAVAFRGGRDEVRHHLERGRPLIALIRVAPDRYHYVVLVGWLGERVVLHDPARGPYLTPRIEELEEAWEPAERWVMLLLPVGTAPGEIGEAEEAPGVSGTPPAAPGAPEGSPCDGLVARGVALARQGATREAAAALESAAAACPEESAPLRERAGLRLREGRPAEAARLSARALALDPGDAHAARTLAAAHYLEGDARAALVAWNRVDAPRVELVQTRGTRRVRPPSVVRALGLRPGELLTPSAFGRAERRLAHLPAIEASRLAYHPEPGGSARVVAAVQEAPSFPPGVADLAVAALRTAAHGEAVLRAAGPLGMGELWTARGRFESARPAAALGLAAPAAWPGAGAVWTVEVDWERQTYRRRGLADAGFVDPGLERVTEERLRGAVELSRWQTGWWRWRVGTALDRWDRSGRHVALSAGLAARGLGDRLSLSAGGERWLSLESGTPFAHGQASAEWRSRHERRGLVWSVRGAGEFASTAAPLAVWPGAGEGRARTPYLRAHPLLEDGQVTGPAFGRALVHGGTELTAWTAPGAGTPLPARVGLAAFLDLVRWGKNLPREPQGFLHADAGVGVRLAPSADGGTLRLDVARGIRDGEVAVTAGWEAAWPRLER